jgi:hypothetical protein
MTPRAPMPPRAWLALIGGCLVASLAHAVTIDDFAAPYPGGGSVVTDGTGSGQLVQSPVAVLGGTRDTRVSAVNPGSPTGVSIIANPSPPPVKNVLEGVIGAGGGSARLGYPGLTHYDVTLGGSGSYPSTIEVLAALMVAGGTLEVTLTDSGGASATDALATHDFAGASLSGLTKYSYYPTAQSFPGVDLGDIDEVAVRLVRPDGADFELSEVRVLAVAAAAVDWSSNAFAFEPASGAADPRVLIGFSPQPVPDGEVATLDLSNPAMPRISWVLGFEPQPFLQLLVATYAGLGINPCTAPNAGFEFQLPLGGDVYKLHFEVSSPSGETLDPGSLVGFNPQPEPPGIFGFGWTGPPAPAHPQSFGVDFDLQAPMAMSAAPALAAAEGATLAFEILDPMGNPIPLALVPASGQSIPVLPPAAAVLLGVALLVGVFASRRRSLPASRRAGG